MASIFLNLKISFTPKARFNLAFSLICPILQTHLKAQYLPSPSYFADSTHSNQHLPNPNKNLQRIKISLQTSISRLFALLEIIQQSKVPNSACLLVYLSLLPYFLISPHYQAQSKATYAFYCDNLEINALFCPLLVD